MYLDHVHLEIRSAASHTSSTLRERFYLSLILLDRSCCVLLVAPSFADMYSSSYSSLIDMYSSAAVNKPSNQKIENGMHVCESDTPYPLGYRYTSSISVLVMKNERDWQSKH